MNNPKEIILHCASTPEGKDFTVQDIDKWHKQRGFKKIGYHYVIYRDGTIKKGRLDNEIGAHCLGHNKDSIGICYIGGLSADGKTPRDTRTVEQKESLYKLVKGLMFNYGITLDHIHCHNEFAKKECPCFKIYDFRDEYLNWVNKNKNNL